MPVESWVEPADDDVLAMTRHQGLPNYTHPAEFPSRVWDAVQLSRQMDVPLACIPEVGRLLMLLASHQSGGRICELGTACGVGAAWLASGMPADATLFTVELDPLRAKASAKVLGAPNVRVLIGDWSLARQHGPFDLLFADGGPKHEPDAPDLILPLLRPGGLLVMDDFSPGRTPAEDATRQIWLGHQSYVTVELQVSSSMAVIMAARR